MRTVLCAQSWHSFDDLHCHFLLMMDFVCPLAFHHKKGSTYLSLQSFCLQGESIFVGWSLWSLDCIQVLHIVFYLFSFCHILLGYSCQGELLLLLYMFLIFNCLLIYIFEFFIDICLYCVLFEIKKLFCLLVFSTHAVMHFVQCFRKYTS